MATPTQLSLAEYLQASYHPVCEYIDANLRERKWEHARVQALVASCFMSREALSGVLVSTKQRTRIAASRVRIADVVLVDAEQQPDVLVAPPCW